MNQQASSKGFQLAEHGVWETLRAYLLSLPRNSVVYWVTYSFGPGESDLKLLNELKTENPFELRVVCRNPKDNRGPVVSVTKRAFGFLASYRELFEEGVRVFPRCLDVGFLDGEEGLPGPLHAKLVVAEVDGKAHPEFVGGSFNLAHRCWPRIRSPLLGLIIRSRQESP